MKKLIFILMLFVASFVMNANNGEKDIELYKSGAIKTKVIKHDNYSQVTKYYETGVVEEVQFFDFSRKRIGHWVRYYENGILMGEANFNNDKKDGDWKIYDTNGKLNVYIKYKHGKKKTLITYV